MSKANTFETEVLAHIFENADVANIGDTTGLRGSSAAGNLYVSLHTANPNEAGDQTTSEIAYTSYARVAVGRTSGNWTTASGAVTNDNAVTFPQCTGGSGTATHFAVGTASSGTGKVLYYGALTASLAISNGITPEFPAGDLDVTED